MPVLNRTWSMVLLFSFKIKVKNINLGIHQPFVRTVYAFFILILSTPSPSNLRQLDRCKNEPPFYPVFLA
jgi:hypothetical protein